MSNNNQFWGQRFGAYSPFVPKGLKEPRGNVFNVKSYGKQKTSNSGKPNRDAGAARQSKIDKDKYLAFLNNGGQLPVIIVKF